MRNNNTEVHNYIKKKNNIRASTAFKNKYII